MKTAVLISGQMRTGERCFPSIKKHVLDKIGEHDVYAHIEDDANVESIMLFAPRLSIHYKAPLLEEKNYIHRTGRQVFGVQQCLRMWWSMYEALRLMQSSDRQYDFVIRLRPDTEFFNDIEPLADLDQNGVYLPKHNNWWGYCDRFAVMGAAWAPAYHSMWPNLDRYIAQNGIFHPETYLKWTLDEACAPIFRTGITFDTVRMDGKRVFPAFHAPCGDTI